MFTGQAQQLNSSALIGS